MEPLQGFPHSHPQCFTQERTSVHNGMPRGNGRKLHQILLSHQRKHGKGFDPIAGYMADEAGGLKVGLLRVCESSVLEKLKTCEFHFLQCANRQRARLHSEKSREFFTRVTLALLQAQTSSAYNNAIVEFVAKKPAKDQRGFLIPWLQWWDDRTTPVFSSFCSKKGTTYKPSRSNPPQMENDRRNTPIPCRCCSRRHQR